MHPFTAALITVLIIIALGTYGVLMTRPGGGCDHGWPLSNFCEQGEAGWLWFKL